MCNKGKQTKTHVIYHIKETASCIKGLISLSCLCSTYDSKQAAG